ncbi:MAG: MarR family transcriptional regulator [Rhodobacteraceae bacterium]|nr:MarR family transcriptional regulator [Paracoccaceae bacterium]
MTPMAAPDPGGGAKLRLRCWLAMLKATKRVENDIRDRLRREFDTTLPRFDVMAMLYKNAAGLKMSQLSSEMMVSAGNVTGIIDRLVADGLVMRVSIKGDRRATLVRLTPKGEADFTSMAAIHEGWVAEIFATLDERDLDHAIRIFKQVRESRT